jgi:hypothetical protein
MDSNSKRLASSIANHLRLLLFGFGVHDSGCSLKVMRRECIRDLRLGNGMHRYIPTILALKGFRVGEVKVNHKPRYKGKTKYGTMRIIRGFKDLLMLRLGLYNAPLSDAKNHMEK